MDIPIIYEDEYFIIIDKPAGIVINRSENTKDATIQDWTEEKLNLPAQAGIIKGSDFYNRGGIVHRLDKETSGILIIAKDENTFLVLQNQFFKRLVKKKYLTLVHGRMEGSAGSIKLPVGRLPWNRTKFGVIVSGREAQTEWLLIKNYKYQENIYSYLSVYPVTGRTHQIRIHLKHQGHSVVADKLYAGRKIYQDDVKFCQRLFLHSWQLSFHHPKTNKTMHFQCKLPLELQAVLRLMERFHEARKIQA